MAARVIVLLGMCASCVRAGVSLTGLGSLPGPIRPSLAYDISSDGATIAGYATSLAGQRAARWTAQTGWVSLGIYPNSTFSYAFGVSDDGLIVSGGNHFSPGVDGFRWTQAGGMVALGNGSFTYEVSGDGSTILGSIANPAGHRPARWRNGWTILADVAGFPFRCSVDGEVIVGEWSSPSGVEAFRWTSGGGLVGLGDFDDGSFASHAFGVSRDGEVVVGRGNGASGEEAFRWTEGTGMVGLGDLAGGSFFSDARAVSDDGSVVVGASNTSLGGEAFVWTEAGGMRRLWDVLAEQGVDPGASGWSRLNNINAMTPDGKIVAGHGMHNGLQEGFVASIPEPGSAVMALVGIVVMIGRSRRGR